SFYLAMLQAKEKIIFTYPVSNNDNGENRISPYLTLLKNALSLNLQFKQSTTINDGLTRQEDYLAFIGSKMQSYGHMLIILREATKRHRTPETVWIGLFKKLNHP